jgi:hypothetical protein
MTNPIEFHEGQAHWTHQEGDRYVCTGTDRRGKRMKPVYTQDWFHAMCINLYCGNKWLIRDGKRYRIVSVVN